VHNGGHREGRQGAGAFFSVIARPEVLARECHHQVNPASEKVVCERDAQAHQSQVELGCDAESRVSHVDDIAPAGDGGWPPRVALSRSSCIGRSNVCAGLMGSVGAVPRTVPMSPPDQSRHFDGAALTSDLARLADILRVIRQVSKVPKPEVVVV